MLILLLFLNILAFSQKKLEGIFITQSLNIHDATTYKFFKDGTFVYSQVSFHSTVNGKGNYSLKNKVLKLHFVPYQPMDTFYVKSERECKKVDSTRIDFKINDPIIREPIPNLLVALKLKNSNILIAFSSTNSEGKTAITLPNIYRDSLLISSVVATSTSYKNFTCSFKPNLCKEIIIDLIQQESSRQVRIPTGTIVEYTFKKFSEKKSDRKGIILKENTTPGAYETVLYKWKPKTLD